MEVPALRDGKLPIGISHDQDQKSIKSFFEPVDGLEDISKKMPMCTIVLLACSNNFLSPPPQLPDSTTNIACGRLADDQCNYRPWFNASVRVSRIYLSSLIVAGMPQ
jgi:hypothetical protein